MTETLSRLTAALADRYTIERELGAGGMATVYLAHDVRHDRKVALKVLRPELSAILGAQRFLHEIKTTANLQHPHILSLYDSGEAGGLVFYVMPFVEGESLRDRLVREKQLPVDDAVRIAGEVADALDYAHRHGVIHRDIKPENILLHDGRAQVADFGIALAVTSAGGGTRMTETGMSLGTPHYMAPEQAMGEKEITPKADIYALGCVLYEMLTGEPPFTGATAQAIIARVMTEHPRSLTAQRRTIPPHVEAAVNAALEKLPADRIGSAAQWAEALQGRGTLPQTMSRTAAAALTPAAGIRTRLPRYGPWLVAAGLAGALAWTQLRHPAELPVRLNVLLPDSNTLRTEGSNNSVALSPDGRVLVYTGQSAHRRRMLYVRQLDVLEPRPIAGTEDADGPTFSPDGAWVAFFASGKLKRVALAGGPPLTIADANSPRGATWGPDGTIVFAGTSGGPLLRVAAAGGRVDTVTRVRVDSGENSHRLPQFLPDGRTVVFTILAGGRFRAAITTFGKPGHRVLVDEATGVRYAPTGHLVYGTEAGALVALPFNARTQAVTGSPVSLLEGLLVKPAVGTADFTFSATGRMVYVAGREEARRLIIVDATGGEHQVGAGTSLTSPRFSPDGKRIAYSSVENRSTDIRVLDIARQTLTRLTFSGLNSYPEWTHDGRRVAFYSNNLGSGTSTGVTGNDLYWALSDGSGHPQPLLVAPGSQMELQFAPGDRTFAYRQTVGSTGRDIWIAAVDSPQNPHAWLATEFEERAMALSPDGHWMAYVSNASGRDEVYVREFPVPSGQWQISADGGIEPRWAHSGRAIFFRGGDSLVSVAVTTRPAFVVGARSLVFARPYFMGDTHHTHWDVAPDDRHFAFVSAPTGSPGLVVTLNWFDELRRRTTSGTGTGTAPGRP